MELEDVYRQGLQGNMTLGELPESCSMYGKDFGILNLELWKKEEGILELMDMGRMDDVVLELSMKACWQGYESDL